MCGRVPSQENLTDVGLLTAEPSAAEVFNRAVEPRLAGRAIRQRRYTKTQVPRFQVPGAFVAYASRGSTHAVTKMFSEQAEKSILIAVCHFTAGCIEELLLKATRRGVSVSLMFDVRNSTKISFTANEAWRYGRGRASEAEWPQLRV